MRHFTRSLIALSILSASSFGQASTNGVFHSLALNQPASSVIGSGPTTAAVFTDSSISINIQGGQSSPVILIFGQLSVGAFSSHPAFTLDIANQGMNYANQILVNGYTRPSPASYTNNFGQLSIAAQINACSTNPVSGTITCITQSSFSVSCQAITVDPANPPFLVNSSAAATAVFANGFTPFTLAGDISVQYNFPAGFTFPFYGISYTRAWVSPNGFVSFGTVADNGFPNPNVGTIRSSTPRIMTYYNDLVPETLSTNPRIYAQYFVESGVAKIKFVHERLAEFGNVTGPHGGECIISQPGDISVFIHTYNALPSINTAVGISPGNNLDTGSPPAIGQTAFGRDLSLDFINAPTFLGQNRAGFEVYTHGTVPVSNTIGGMAGFGFPLGIEYSIDSTLPPGQNGYFIHQ